MEVSVLSPVPQHDIRPNELTGPAAGAEVEAHRDPCLHIVRPGRWLQLFSPDHFEIAAIRMPIPHLPPKLAGLRILHLTDIHLNPAWLPAYDELIEHVSANPPDLILSTGDLIDNKFDHKPALPTLKRLLTALKSRIGLFTILGNHDGDLLEPDMIDWGIHVINGRCVDLVDGDTTLELIGLAGVSRGDAGAKFLTAILPRRPGVPRIVLAHYPDHLNRILPLNPDFILTGHTHGGQICLPGGRPIITHDALHWTMSQGLHKVGDSWLIVSRGFGFSTYRIRLFAPAQIIEIELLSKLT